MTTPAAPPQHEGEWTTPAIFAYGLLRPGERYWPELAPAVRRHRPARIRGRLYVHASGAYPMLDCAGDGWVSGDVLDVGDVDAVHRLVFMELTAGYDARWARIYPPDGDDPIGSGIAFCWPWGETHRGDHITSGDWRHR